MNLQHFYQSRVHELVEHLTASCADLYGAKESVKSLIEQEVSNGFSHLFRTNMLYHNYEHTMLVVLCCAEIMCNKQKAEGDVSESEFLSAVLAALYHDIGCVHPLDLIDTRAGMFHTGLKAGHKNMPPKGTNAVMMPYHVDRGKLYVKRRFKQRKDALFQAQRVVDLIEMTRFPFPEGRMKGLGNITELVPAADLIGQLSDPHYLQKVPGLYHEFEECGTNQAIGYRSPNDVVYKLKEFYQSLDQSVLAPAIGYLQHSPNGKMFIEGLDANLRVSKQLQQAAEQLNPTEA